MKTIDKRRRRFARKWLRILLGMVAVGAPPPLGASISAPEPIERVAQIRARLQEADAKRHAASSLTEQESASRIAQWFNWPNWRNWGNWPNWRNW